MKGFGESIESRIERLIGLDMTLFSPPSKEAKNSLEHDNHQSEYY